MSCLCLWPFLFFSSLWFIDLITQTHTHTHTHTSAPTLFIQTTFSGLTSSSISHVDKRKATGEYHKQTNTSILHGLRSGQLALDKVKFIHCLRTSRLSQTRKKKQTLWPAGCIHFNVRLEEVGRSEHGDFIKANGDAHSGPARKVRNEIRVSCGLK